MKSQRIATSPRHIRLPHSTNTHAHLSRLANACTLERFDCGEFFVDACTLEQFDCGAFFNNKPASTDTTSRHVCATCVYVLKLEYVVSFSILQLARGSIHFIPSFPAKVVAKRVKSTFSNVTELCVCRHAHVTQLQARSSMQNAKCREKVRCAMQTSPVLEAAETKPTDRIQRFQAQESRSLTFFWIYLLSCTSVFCRVLISIANHGKKIFLLTSSAHTRSSARHYIWYPSGVLCRNLEANGSSGE